MPRTRAYRTDGKLTEVQRERLWAKVSHTESCWTWNGNKVQGGYGRIGVYGKPWLTHRAVWHTYMGDIPDGMHVCHRCDNPSCVRPSHLFVGTPKDNVGDMIAKGRKVSRSGEDHGYAKLSNSQAMEIRRRVLAGENQRLIGEDYGVTQSTVSLIKYGKTWKCVA